LVQVQLNFNNPKADMRGRLQRGTEVALFRADFLHSKDIIIIQALTIYLSTKNCDQRVVWSLNGLLTRLAMSAGLHRDGASFSALTIFEAEMRRRLWWHICFLDAYTDDVELAEATISPRMFDTAMPTNVNDADLDPAMLEEPSPREGLTDVSVCLLRCEMWQTSKRVKCWRSSLPMQKLDLTMEDGKAIFVDLQARIQTRFGSILEEAADPKGSFHTSPYLMEMAGFALEKYELLTHSQGVLSSLDKQADDRQGKCSDRTLWLAASVLRRAFRIRHDADLARWSWTTVPVQWHALMMVMSELIRRHRWGREEHEAWMWAAKSFPDMPKCAKKEAFWPCLSRLAMAVKRQSARQRATMLLELQPIGNGLTGSARGTFVASTKGETGSASSFMDTDLPGHTSAADPAWRAQTENGPHRPPGTSDIIEQGNANFWTDAEMLRESDQDMDWSLFADQGLMGWEEWTES
jgi:hypothetical protein